MAIWTWSLVAAGALLTTSVVVGFAVARVLGEIASVVTTLLDGEDWSAAPLTRALVEDATPVLFPGIAESL